MILRMNHQALYAPIPIFQRSSNVPRGTFSKDQHLFQYSDVSRGTFLRKNALRHHPFDFSILVRSKNSLHILDSNSQELFFSARLIVWGTLMPGSLKLQTRCADSRINSYCNAQMFHVEHFQEKPSKRRSFTLSSPTNMILRMNQHALHSNIPIFQRSSNVPRGTFLREAF